MSITLNWNVCTNAALSQPITTHVERADNGGTFLELPSQPYTTGGLVLHTYVDTTVTSGNSYSYRMRWSNGTEFSDYSAATPSLTVTIPRPAQPTGLVATLS